jgi:hypothetical protein
VHVLVLSGCRGKLISTGWLPTGPVEIAFAVHCSNDTEPLHVPVHDMCTQSHMFHRNLQIVHSLFKCTRISYDRLFIYIKNSLLISLVRVPFFLGCHKMRLKD